MVKIPNANNKSKPRSPNIHTHNVVAVSQPASQSQLRECVPRKEIRNRRDRRREREEQDEGQGEEEEEGGEM